MKIDIMIIIISIILSVLIALGVSSFYYRRTNRNIMLRKLRRLMGLLESEEEWSECYKEIIRASEDEGVMYLPRRQRMIVESMSEKCKKALKTSKQDVYIQVITDSLNKMCKRSCFFSKRPVFNDDMGVDYIDNSDILYDLISDIIIQNDIVNLSSQDFNEYIIKNLNGFINDNQLPERLFKKLDYKMIVETSNSMKKYYELQGEAYDSINRFLYMNNHAIQLNEGNESADDKGEGELKGDNNKKRRAIDICAICISAVTLFYSIINNVFIIVFRNKCERFYGVPGEYFDAKVDTRLFYLMCVMALLIAAFLPGMMRKNDKKMKNCTITSYISELILSIYIGLAIGMINIYNLEIIINHLEETSGIIKRIYYYVDFPIIYIIWISVVSSIIVTVGLFISEEVNDKVCKKIFGVIWCVALLICLLVMIYGTAYRLMISIEDKTKYEFVTYGDDPYERYVVLSKMGDERLVVPIELNDKNEYIFKTSTYMLKKSDGAYYEYIDMGKPPIIEKSIE